MGRRGRTNELPGAVTGGVAGVAASFIGLPALRDARVSAAPKMLGARLHVGCGPRRLPGWINADAVPGVGDAVVDLHDSAALGRDTYREIYGCHVLEHCWPQDTPAILRRMRDALLPGGTLRLSVPDIRLVVKNCIDGHAYGDERSALSVLYGGTFSRETSAPDLHRQMFWRERLARLLAEAGFVNVREWGRGQYPAIDALGDYATTPFDVSTGKSLISLNMEADRPGDLAASLPRPVSSGAPIDVSVILGTVDRPQMLRDCVGAIRESLADSGLTHEIVVAYGREDDKSDPSLAWELGSVAWMRQQHDVVPVFGGMDGAIEAFNRAYATSRGRLICQINDDVFVDGDSIARAAQHLDADPSSAGVVFKFDRGDGQNYRHETLAGSLHPNQMVVRRETCEAVVERIGAFWGDAAHRTDKTYGGDSAFGVVCRHLGLRLDSVDGVTCRDLLAVDALRATNKAAVAPDHGARWCAMYEPYMTGVAPAPNADEWPNVYVPRRGQPPRRSPIDAGRPLRLLHLTVQSEAEPQTEMRTAFARLGPTLAMPWRRFADVLVAARAHRPDVVFAQIQGGYLTPQMMTALRAAVGSSCTLVNWTGDVRTSAAQPVERWLVDQAHYFDIMLASSATYARKLKIDEQVLMATGYLGCGVDAEANAPNPDAVEDSDAIFFGNHYQTLFYPRVAILAEVSRALPGALTVYGNGWEQTDVGAIAQPFVSKFEAAAIMHRARVTISTSLFQDLTRYTSDRLKRSMMSGAVTAVHAFDDMEGLGLVPYGPGDSARANCLAWRTTPELVELLRDWLRPERAAERREIRARAAAVARERYTWERIVEELLAIVRDYRARRGLA